MEEFNNAKIPPHSSESEQSVLGGLMISSESWDEVGDILSANDFYIVNHKIIFGVIKLLLDHNENVDILTVKNQLIQTGDDDKIGGFEYLATIAENTPSIANITSYANHIRELSVYRQLIAVSTHIADSAYHPKGIRTQDLIDQAETRIFAISEQISRKTTSFANVKNKIKDIVEDVQKRHDNVGISGLETGFSELDKLTNGLQKSDLIIIAGRPSMGKTAITMNIVEHVAINNNLPVLVFSLEMSIDQLMMRMISSSFRINMGNMQRGKMSADEWSNFNQAANVLEHTNIIIDETPSITPTEVRSRARRIKREHPELALIVIDYLQLMSVSGVGENRNQEISTISRLLKALAKELNLPVVALSQLNRSVESRPKADKGRMPQMSDLRESGSIEQDADVIALIYRDEAYHDKSFQNPDEKGKADLKIAKHRNGETGWINLTFIGEYARFETAAPQLSEYEEEQISNSYADSMDDFAQSVGVDESEMPIQDSEPF